VSHALGCSSSCHVGWRKIGSAERAHLQRRVQHAAQNLRYKKQQQQQQQKQQQQQQQQQQ